MNDTVDLDLTQAGEGVSVSRRRLLRTLGAAGGAAALTPVVGLEAPAAAQDASPSGTPTVTVENPVLVDYVRPNRTATVQWVDVTRASQEARERLTGEAARALVDPVQAFVAEEFSGTLTDLQIRYSSVAGGGILRGYGLDAEPAVLDVPDRDDFTEWVDITTAMLDHFLEMPGRRVDALLAPIQEWIAARAGPEAMSTDIQFAMRAPSGAGDDLIVIAAGVWKWEPPSRHLHLVIVIVI